jgi:carboxyl-terminal processing protease
MVLSAGSRFLFGAVLAVSVLRSSWLAVAAAPPAPLASATAAAGSVTEVGNLLRQGQQLEIQHRWSEALTLYEDGVRQHPGDADLQRRFDFTRLHYDLCRRYRDNSFRDAVARLSLLDALDLYSDVVGKMQVHYVEIPRWKELIERGTNDLEVALTEPSFVEGLRLKVEPRVLDDFRQELWQQLGPRVVAGPMDARQAVADAARLGQQRLGLSPTAVVLEYVCGAANSLDVYSCYLTPDQLNDVYSQIEGNFVGLGVELKSDDGALLIVRVIHGSPAEHQGLRSGDRILEVDGHATRKYPTDQAANLLQGAEGTVAQLLVQSPGGQARTLGVPRQRVEVPSVDEVQMLDRGQGTGYFKLTCFQKTTSRDMDEALWSLHRDGMRSLIVDLRGNPGGLLVTAVEVADKFIDRGVIVSTHGRNPQEDFTYSAHGNGGWRMPLVVLIDQDSASAAEIFAGAIRDHHRGTIIGKRSYGKGSVQGIFPLTVGNAGLRLTTAKFYSPNGYPFAGIGVTPDLVVQQVARPVGGSTNPAKEDPVLIAAIQAARQMVAQR